MRWDVISLFPEVFSPYFSKGVIRRAITQGLVELHYWNPRTYAPAENKGRVDDRPYGGGPGMVLMAEPLWQCLQVIRQHRIDGATCPLIYFTPSAPLLTQATVNPWVDSAGGIILCGRYEGVDQRFIDQYVDHVLSIGDYVLSGGELPTMVFLEALLRLLPGVLHSSDSLKEESFQQDLQGQLDYPHYTRPEIWQGQPVPEVLLSGHHKNIGAWRSWQSKTLTEEFRPDLIPDKP
ncbi:MAG: tRNA (guanosine(37)-N1)-methyltransferase TrmD [Gammaproteobacteria bacterium]|nr:tRNA (guanosine(37)-N1)-methyltransferase TrmD [Gammaproteobacteria bacterium]